MADVVPSRRGRAALDAARLDREVATERLINVARRFGLVLGIVQFGLFTDYLPGTRVAGLIFATCYFLTALVSTRILDGQPTYEVVRKLSAITLGIDTALLAATAIVLAYQDDPTNLFLMVLPMLEGAMKRGMAGALVMSGIAMAVEVGRLVVRQQLHMLPVEYANTTFFAGMMLIIGLFIGGLVRQQMLAQDALAATNDRLSTTRRLLRSGLASFSGGKGLRDLLAEAVDGFSLSRVVVVDADDRVVAVPKDAGDDPVVGVLGRALEDLHSGNRIVDHVDGQGRRWLAMPIDPGAAASGSLYTCLSDDAGRGDAIALQAELAALMRASAALALEEELREARRRLDGLRHDFISITTHEVRTPITVIRAGVEMLKHGTAGGRREEMLEAIDRQARRLERVVEDLQVVQRLDAGGVGVRHERLPLERVVAGALEGAADDVELGIRPGAVAWADAQLLGTVLRCLVDNALTHGGGRDVRVLAGRHGDEVVVDVSDAGPGIPAQARSRVFERFAAADARHHSQGAGIGLPLARELARLMDGDVVLLDHHEELDDHRTTFRLTLPAPEVVAG